MTIEERINAYARSTGLSPRAVNALCILREQSKELPRGPRFRSIQERCLKTLQAETEEKNDANH